MIGSDCELPGWFCLAHPLKCTAEGPERGDAAPQRCPKCGSMIGITIFGDEDDGQSSPTTFPASKS